MNVEDWNSELECRQLGTEKQQRKDASSVIQWGQAAADQAAGLHSATHLHLAHGRGG